MFTRKNLLTIVIFFLAVCLAASIVLFAACKGNLESSHWLIPALRTLRYHAALIVGLMVAAGLAGAGTAFWASPMRLPILLARDKIRAVWIMLLFAFSITPIGNRFRYQSIFYENWMWYCVFWILSLCLILAMALQFVFHRPFVLLWLGERFEGAHRFLARERYSRADALFVAAASLLAGVGTLLISHFVLGDIPHVQDSLAQAFQAKVFAHGRMALPAPADPEFFERIYVVAENGRWYSIYPPGFALVLSLGMSIGKPHWVNPIVSAAIVPLTFLLAARHLTFYAARVGTLFLPFSLFFLIMGSGFMNHPVCLLFLLLFLLFFFEACPAKEKRLFLLVPTGFFWGMGYLTRPMTALAFLAAAGLWILIRWPWKGKRLWFAVFAFLLGTVPPAVFYLQFNAHTTGSPWLMGYTKYFGGNPLGFGLRPWGAKPLGPRIPNEVFHSPMRGMANTNAQLNGLNYYLFGWPIPSLAWAFFLFAPGMRRCGFDRFCAGVIALVLGVYFFYFFQDYCYGPRFVYETIPFWLLLTARGIEEAIEKAKGSSLLSERKTVGLIYSFIAVFFIAAFSTAWVERINVMGNAYWGANPAVADKVRHGVQEKNAVIFVDDPQDYVAVYSFLNPGLDKGWIVAHNLGAERNERLLNRYPGWPVYRLRLKEAERGYVTVLEKYDPAQSAHPE
ncbi:MAG: hypothetical protein AB1656_20705 [Candidatus Omnitrophota bacterium]